MSGRWSLAVAFPLKIVSLAMILASGCAWPGDSRHDVGSTSSQLKRLPAISSSQTVVAVSHEMSDAEELPATAEQLVLIAPLASVVDLEASAEISNPLLRQLLWEFRAARAKARHVDKLPDPTMRASLFGHPIETAAGSQRANLTVSQLLPWLPRLDAQARQACFEALSLRQVYAAERLKVIAEIRTMWYRLYVLQKQIEVNLASQALMKTLIDVANARVRTGQASQGDVLAGTLEYSRIEESIVDLRQRLVSTKAEINRIAGRDATTPIDVPEQIDTHLPDWDHPMLRELAWSHQPEIESARIRLQATRWGVEVAKLKRRPDLSLNASWFAIDDNRPTTGVVDVGKDAWALGAMVSVPLWHKRYAAIEQEARWHHAASHASVDQMVQRYDAVLLDLWEQAQAADETARLYRDTMIPEAERTLAADQVAYANGRVEFDRLVRDFRNLLTLELGFHRAAGRMATAIARIQQAAGIDLTSGDAGGQDSDA